MLKVTRRASATRRLLLACSLALVATFAAPTTAQAQQQSEAKRFLEDFNYYVFIANLDLAEANAQALIDTGITPSEFLALVEDSPTLERRFDEAYQRALLITDLEDDAAALYKLYDTGRKERARNQDEILRNIDLLGGDARQRFAARARLLEAREYAVPELLNTALNSDRIDVRANATELLVDLGRNAAVPLTVALPYLGEEDQERVAYILSQIQHSVSVPFLYELWTNASVPATREAAELAINRISDDGFDEDASLAELFREHAERYYNDRKSGQLFAFPGEDNQLLWEWRQGLGLYPAAIRSDLYHEAMAMRSAAHALGYDADDAQAQAIWLAANISRDIDQPADYENPVYPSSNPSADYYAAALGHETSQRVLARALDDRDVPIARAAIRALRATAGSVSLSEGMGDERPLLDALAYPDRRVRYDAALALAAADPRVSFAGAERVVPTLAGMITQAGKRYALVIASEPPVQQDLRDTLEDAGYDVLPPIASMAEVGIALADAPGVDLILADLPGESLLQAREAIRASSQLGAAPMIALATGNTLELVRNQDDPLTHPLRRGVQGDDLVNAAERFVNETVGAPLSEDDALIYAGFALASLRDLAISRNEVLNPADATATLLENISETSGYVRRQVAEVLSYVNRSQAQQALAEAAADAFEAGEQAMMLKALAGSARRFGNMLEDNHEHDVIDLATNGDENVRQAAAEAAGALALPGSLTAPIVIDAN